MVTIRNAQPDDAETIAYFQEQMALETENLVLDPNVIREGVNNLFNSPENGQYFVAETKDGIIAGSLLITYEWSDWRNSFVYWIQSVFVQKNFRRQGIYKALYHHVQKMAQENPEVAGIRLYVDKTNHTAQKTYANLGMNGEHYQLFEWMKS